MKKLLIKSLLLAGVSILAGTLDIAAQGKSIEPPKKSNQFPGNSGQAPGRNKPTGVPIDGGAGILLAAGAAYGLKKLRDYHHHKTRKGDS